MKKSKYLQLLLILFLLLWSGYNLYTKLYRKEPIKKISIDPSAHKYAKEKIILNKKDIDNFLKDSKGVLKQAKAKPYIVENRIVAFQLDSIKEPSFFFIDKAS